MGMPDQPAKRDAPVLPGKGLSTGMGWDRRAEGMLQKSPSKIGVDLQRERGGKRVLILCSGLNRLAHSSLELVELLREFASRKITLIIPNQRIDTSKMPGKAFLDVLDAISEFKHSTATESIRAGLAAARKRGARLGRPQTVNAHLEDVKRLRAATRIQS
jgi:DNA invertase Pin-like site-specific DNA recombinase